jgi:hypothetical protein
VVQKVEKRIELQSPLPRCMHFVGLRVGQSTVTKITLNGNVSTGRPMEIPAWGKYAAPLVVIE